MANPNKTVAAARNKKMYCVKQQSFHTQQEADNFASQCKAENQEHTVRVTSYKYGSYANPCRGYTVRCYER